MRFILVQVQARVVPVSFTRPTVLREARGCLAHKKRGGERPRKVKKAEKRAAQAGRLSEPPGQFMGWAETRAGQERQERRGEGGKGGVGRTFPGDQLF